MGVAARPRRIEGDCKERGTNREVASADVSGAAAGKSSGPGEWAGEVLPLDELAALLARFGMIVGLNTSPEADKVLQGAQLADGSGWRGSSARHPGRAGLP